MLELKLPLKFLTVWVGICVVGVVIALTGFIIERVHTTQETKVLEQANPLGAPAIGR